MDVLSGMPAPTILWFRQDLRLSDQPALIAAAANGPVIPVYVLDDETPGAWAMGGAQRWWLHHTLAALRAALETRGSRLILRRGPAEATLRDLLDQTGATTIHAIRHSEPWWHDVEAALGDAIVLHQGNHLTRMGEVRTGSGSAYKIFSPFWRALCTEMPPPDPCDPPDAIPAPERFPAGESLDGWALLPSAPDWAGGFDVWTPGEAGAETRLSDFVDRVAGYAEDRNRPAIEGTSGLSPHLHFGEVSPRTVWHRLAGRAGAEDFLRELAWRDFTDQLTLAIPDYADRNGRPKFDALPWRDHQKGEGRRDLTAWQRGRTGYPIVDAGMRQLWSIGWMHNRVRMIAASFLVKHLLIDWREGERWFWDTLVDADYGNNSVNWQWIAGTGTDANMFGRIMAPLSQSEKFDAGDYIRQWVPELAHLSDAVIHDPEAAGCLPTDYPAKIIGHREGRERALAAGRKVR